MPTQSGSFVVAVDVIVVLGDEGAVKLWVVVAVEDKVVVSVRLRVMVPVLVPVDVWLVVAVVVAVVPHDDRSTDSFLNTVLMTPDNVLATSSPVEAADLKNPYWSHASPVAPRSDKTLVARAHVAFSSSRRA